MISTQNLGDIFLFLPRDYRINVVSVCKLWFKIAMNGIFFTKFHMETKNSF